MCVCVYVCVCVCVCVCIMYMYAYLCIYMYVCIICISIFIGNSAAFLDLVHQLTNKPLTGDPWVRELSLSVEELKVGY